MTVSVGGGEGKDAAADQLMPATPDAVDWCLTLWRGAQDRLRRQARDHERRAAHLESLAARLNVWRDFPWSHAARTVARLDAIGEMEAAVLCRSGAAYARDVLSEIGARASEPLMVTAEALALSVNPAERDGEWKGGDRLPLEGISAIRVPGASMVPRLRRVVSRHILAAEKTAPSAQPSGAWTERLECGHSLSFSPGNPLTEPDAEHRPCHLCASARHRPDLGFPATYELTDQDHERDADAARYSRYFRLDGLGDWPRVVEVTAEVQHMLTRRHEDRRSDLIGAEAQRRQLLTAADGKTPTDYLKAKQVGSVELVVDFIREGQSGDKHRSISDFDGKVGTPSGEVRTPLQQLRAAFRVDGGQAAAGEQFAEHFTAAQFDLGKGTDYGQVRGTAGVAEKLPSTAAEEERQWVHAAMDALGGGASPLAMAVWSVVGAQMSVGAFATSRHFRMPGGQRWLSELEAEAILHKGLAALRAHLDAPTVEYQHRRHGLKARVAGTVELSFLIGSRRFRVVAEYAPGIKAWVGVRIATRRGTSGKPVGVRHWCVKGPTLGLLTEAAVAGAVAQVKALIAPHPAGSPDPASSDGGAQAAELAASPCLGPGSGAVEA